MRVARHKLFHRTKRHEIPPTTRTEGNPMSAKTKLKVPSHYPIPMYGSNLGHWIECECSWISPSYYTPDTAMKAHQKHVQAVTK